MSGTPDFFYREAQRLGYVARSAFKLIQMQKQYKIISPGGSVLDLGCAPGAWLQVACQNLGPLEKGGVVVGIDTKKVKVPPLHCDSRVKTVCADVMKLPREQVRALSPKMFMLIEDSEKLIFLHDSHLYGKSLLVSLVSSSKLTALAQVTKTPIQQFLPHVSAIGVSISQQKGFSVILSDMCPLVSGITSRDAALSTELGMRAIDLAVGKSVFDHTGNNASPEVQPDGSGSAPDTARLLKSGGHLIIKLLESEDVKEFNQICKPLFRKASWLRPKATRSCSREIYLICQSLL